MADPLGRIESLYGPTLAAGARIGVYEIVAPIGAGGMGEVYRAHDSKLGRDVAIKVLPQSFAADSDRQTRLEREARLLAALNHPNIAQVYGLEESDGVLGLVMELVDGETLADRIARGPVPLLEALPVAQQIAEALASAHEQSIIHRDLKPANVKVRPDGSVKVLDFGLAKWTEPADAADVMNSPTLSARSTQQGLILGTAAYMSPEQASGQHVDRRTDLWSFGVVLFEMLTARRVFDGETVSHIIAAVLKSEPDWSSLPLETPESVRTLLRRCLAKDPKRRLDSAATAVLEFEDATIDTSVAGTTVSFSRRRALTGWYVAAAAIVVAVAALLTRRVNGPHTLADSSPVISASIDVPQGYVLGDDDTTVQVPTRTPFVFTPDGQSLIIQAARDARPQLFLRSLDRPARPIAGTDGARVPFVSPDGQWVGFYTNHEVRKIRIEGGEAVTICPLQSGDFGPEGAAWGNGGAILFADEESRRIMRVSANGGTPTMLTAEPGYPRRHVAPSFLPDGKRFLFSDVSWVDLRDARLMVQSLDGGVPRVLVSDATDGRMLPGGKLAFMRRGSLMVVGFDPEQAITLGEPVVALRDVMQSGLHARAGALNTGAGMFAVSTAGALVAARGGLTGGEPNHLVWLNKQGRAWSAEPANGAPIGNRFTPRISPDGTRLVVVIGTADRWQLWIGDWARNTWTPCPECSNAGPPVPAVWSPNGRQLLVQAGGDSLVAHTVDGSAPNRLVTREPGKDLRPAEWLNDGRIVYLSGDVTSSEQRITILEPGATAGRVIAVGWAPAVSPDRHWLAYGTGAAAEANVFIQAFPSGQRRQVSAAGGSDPAWSSDGRTLYYLKSVSSDPTGYGSMLFAVDVATASDLTLSAPRFLFQTASRSLGLIRCYEVTRDSRFLIRDAGERPHSTVTQMDLILNWTSTLPK